MATPVGKATAENPVGSGFKDGRLKSRRPGTVITRPIEKFVGPRLRPCPRKASTCSADQLSHIVRS